MLLMRIGAICAGLYVGISILSQVYLSSQPQATTKPHATPIEQDSTLLTFAHSHGSLLIASVLLAVIAFLLLGGAALGVFAYVAAYRPRHGRIILAVGLAALAISIVAVIGSTIDLSSAASQYSRDHLASTVRHFEDRWTGWGIVSIVGSEAIAIWLGILAVALIRIQGNRRLPGWATLAAAFLAGIGFPVLIVWAAGAAFGLWRMSAGGMEPASQIIEATGTVEEAAPRPASASGARQAGPPVRRGSGTRRRRHH
jgi:hypothetical protein